VYNISMQNWCRLCTIYLAHLKNLANRTCIVVLHIEASPMLNCHCAHHHELWLSKDLCALIVRISNYKFLAGSSYILGNECAHMHT